MRKIICCWLHCIIKRQLILSHVSLDREINPFTAKEAIINTYINASSSQSYGSELTGQFYPTKWWDFTTNVNLYNSTINAS
ncbi:MAG: outer membrane beta-barrel protein [Segetibacter sp.]